TPKMLSQTTSGIRTARHHMRRRDTVNDGFRYPQPWIIGKLSRVSAFRRGSGELSTIGSTRYPHARCALRLDNVTRRVIRRGFTSTNGQEATTMATKTAAFPRLAQVQESLKGLQSEGEKLIARVRKEAGKLVSKDQRKAIDSFLSQAKSIRT